MEDVYRRVMCRIKPEEVEQCFMEWVRAIKQEYEREIIAIDGKTVRGHFKSREGGKALPGEQESVSRDAEAPDMGGEPELMGEFPADMGMDREAGDRALPGGTGSM